jgi:gamma-glutamyltranspeptidase / glutathione hydrolase
MHFWYTLRDQLGRVDNEDRLRFSKNGRNIFFDDNGDALRPGMILKNPDMANTLRRIAKDGADAFYKGEIAEEIAADMAANGGLLGKQDLADYQTTRIDPLWGDYRGYRVATNNPPGGGLMMVEMMNILENFDLSSLGHNSVDYIRTVAEAMKYGTIDKDAFIGDPNFVDVPVARLSDKSYAGEIAAKIKNGERANVKRVQRAEESKDTTQVSVLDRHGNAVTMTHSLGMPSGVITDGLGFMYNGCMGVFDPRPGHADSLAPGKSRFSAMAPSLVFRGDSPDPYLVIGAPGGTQINIGIMQAILNVLDFDMSILEAISAPRFSATSNAIDVMNRIPRFITDELASDGYEIVRNPLGFGIAAVHGIKNDNGTRTGAADPGHDGIALEV